MKAMTKDEVCRFFKAANVEGIDNTKLTIERVKFGTDAADIFGTEDYNAVYLPAGWYACLYLPDYEQEEGFQREMGDIIMDGDKCKFLDVDYLIFCLSLDN